MNRCISLLYLFIAVSLPAFASEPFTLSKAIEKGLMNNLSLDFATQENRIGVKNMRMKYRKYFPTLSLGYSSTDTVTYFADDSHTKQLSATFTQLIYDRGVLHSSIHLEKERLALEAHQNDLNRTAFIFSVIDSYKNVLELEKELEISRQARSAVSQQVEIGHLEHNLGEITQFDFLELELALADMDIQITQISQKLDEARSAFASVMNMKACDIPVLMGELNYLYDGFVNE
ncbi:MAG: TolC family protein, partial [Spirochaetia bacterium]|nr:TolC family protein [Spirochaetia bacterium]